MGKKADSVVFKDRLQGRRWLRANHKRVKEVWLVLPKKSAAGISYRVYYNEALEEAIRSVGLTAESGQ